MATRPNVLLLFMDDMTHRAIGALGDRRVRTPNLDRLVRRGTAFTHAFNQGSWTGAVCIPARAMLLTGMSLFDARREIERAPLLGETFRAAGYATHFTGKWHNGDDTLRRCFATIGPHGGGFYPSTDERGDAYGRPAPGNRWDPTDTTRGGHWLPTPDGGVEHSSVRWADAAVAFLDEHARRAPETPFFLQVAFHAPHDPRQAPAEFLAMYPPDTIDLPPNVWPEHPFDHGDFRVRDELLAPWPRTPDAVRLHRREYFAMVTHADQQIGRILDTLRERGLEERTIVAFSGDHGLALGEHGLMGKQNLYDHSVRVPLVFAGPGVPRGRRRAALTHQNAIFPTLCALTGVPIPPSVQAPSLVPVLRDPRRTLHDALFGAYRDVQRMVRTRDRKLVVYPEARRVQLFDLRADPWETRDLSDDPAHARERRALWQRLEKLQRAHGDPLILPDPDTWKE